jgi:hypothetical protein
MSIFEDVFERMDRQEQHQREILRRERKAMRAPRESPRVPFDYKPGTKADFEKWLPKLQYVARKIGTPSPIQTGLVNDVRFSSQIDRLQLWTEDGFYHTLGAVRRLMHIRKLKCEKDTLVDFDDMYANLMTYIETLFALAYKYGGLEAVAHARDEDICDDIEENLLKPMFTKLMPKGYPYTTPTQVRKYGYNAGVLLWCAKASFHHSASWQNAIELYVADLCGQNIERSNLDLLEKERAQQTRTPASSNTLSGSVEDLRQLIRGQASLATPSVCAFCGGTPEVLKQCAGCHKIAYCNMACQKGHWKTHKKECLVKDH